MKKLLPFFLILLLFMGLVPAKGQAAETEPQMKVELKQFLTNPTSISLGVTGTYKIDGTSLQLNKDRAYSIKVEQGSLGLYEGNTKLTSAAQLSITPGTETDTASINDRAYFGSFLFKVENNSYVRPVNIVGMEDYLKSVVPSEMVASSWSMEALKTQAVAARSYAYYHRNKTINDTTRYQAYKGAGNLHSRTTEAVEATSGEMVTYGGTVIEAVYSASNGGMTENNQNEFGGALLPYFSIKEDPYDTKITWSTSINKQQIDTTALDLSNPDKWWNATSEKNKAFADNVRAYMQNNGYANKQIKIVSIPKLSFYDKTPSTRVTKSDLTVKFFTKDVFEAGELKLQTYSITGATADRMRSFIGYSQMKSNVITAMSEDNSLYSLEGRGYGHGVGMSQHGANNRGIAGHSYKDILGFYYTGTQVTKVYNEVEPEPEPVYQQVKVQLNGKDYTPGYLVDGHSHLHWKVLEALKIPFSYKGNTSFVIEGRSVEGKYINNALYINWNDISPGKLRAESITGGYNFIYDIPVKIQLNGKDFTSGYYIDGTTYVHWKALDTFKVPYTFKGNGVFIIDGRTVQGRVINGGLYINWIDLSPGKITFKSISGGFNFIYTVPIKVQLNGQDFTAGYFKEGAAFVHWKALETFKIPFTWKGNVSFVIDGRSVQGEYINGALYIRWNLIAPGKLTFKQIPGGYNFNYTP
ncbi:SpoIID/LytB domain-containing protein [Neobacillus sp. CF12]|uniref:SpoIID/LytB domain-containing protein n=1 Tax=Neobacillus sp. CF12 TaxID=3055864 RepID=UPI0025A21236|nr:SpoIID/LytB domain-containing protein [Neobacillus sp. CF12]MDM5329809.1 SpoIID/LytB domain-containing protein [Neobacillus sp. CF12]